MPAPPEIASRLAIPDRADVVLRRLRFLVDDVPVQLVSAYFTEHALRLPSGVPITRSIRTAYAADEAVEVLDAIAHGEVVSHRFEINLGARRRVV